jgi:PAS domain S-box-containing protein
MSAKNLTSQYNFMSHPLLCWDIASTSIYKLLYDPKSIDLYRLKELAKKYNWIIDIQKLIADNTYEALIVTNNQQNILWTNEGFTGMTGYSASFTKNKRPSFLQGANTSGIVKRRIREQLAENLIINETIINYRKSGKSYECDLHILPLFNHTANCTHYIALEKTLN